MENEKTSKGAEATLAALLDEIIPGSEDGRFPGAGALGLAASIRAAAAADEELAAAFRKGLESLAAAARRHGAESFSVLDSTARRQALERMAGEAPELFARLLAQTASHYYSHPLVVAALGLRAGPPFPRGYEIAPLDESLLEPVRRRAPIYRKA